MGLMGRLWVDEGSVMGRRVLVKVSWGDGWYVVGEERRGYELGKRKWVKKEMK